MQKEKTSRMFSVVRLVWLMKEGSEESRNFYAIALELTVNKDLLVLGTLPGRCFRKRFVRNQCVGMIDCKY